MNGDISRDTFHPWRQYTGVRLQQGRVQLDADWNEQIDIALSRERTVTRDVVGPGAVPEVAPGFALTPPDPDGDGAGSDLLIGFGHAYVAGVLAQNQPAPPRHLVAVTGDAGAFHVTAGAPLAVGMWLQAIPDGSPIVGPRFVRVQAVVAPVAADAGLQRVRLAPVPTATDFVAPVLPSLGAQPDLRESVLPTTAGTFLAYLDVFERTVTALDAPDLREVALGNPDTATRTQQVWVVYTQAASSTGSGSASCADFPPGWQPDPSAKARLAASTVPGVSQQDPCLTPDPGGYRGIENQLYRVEVHNGGRTGTGQVSVKWARDNASYRVKLTDLTNGRLVVDETRLDAMSVLAPDQWVEVLDEASVLAGRPGFFVRLGELAAAGIAVAEVRDPVTLAPLTTTGGQPDTSGLPKLGTLRRFDGGVPVRVTPGTQIPLENGIQVVLDQGTLATGDAWTIPARTLTGAIEWPHDPATGTQVPLPPREVRRAYMALGLIERTAGGRFKVLSDCRTTFPPLSWLVEFSYLGGDGQEISPVMPPGDTGTPVPLPLSFRVGVSRGKTPLAGWLVQFTTNDAPNPGQLSPTTDTPPAEVQTNTPQKLVVRTGADGVAQAAFAVNGNRAEYTVWATLLADDATTQTALPIRFGVRLLRAADVGYDPSACSDLKAAGATTVQAAIDALCARSGGSGCCITVGDKGQFPTIEAALKALGATSDICLCLLPGDHKSDTLATNAETTHLAIEGSSPESCRLVLTNETPTLSANAIRLSGFSIETNVPGATVTLTAESIAIDGMHIEAAPQGSTNPLLSLSALRELRVTDSRISAPSGQAMQELQGPLSAAQPLFAVLTTPLTDQQFWATVEKGIPDIEAMTLEFRTALSARWRNQLKDAWTNLLATFSLTELRGIDALAQALVPAGTALAQALGGVRDAALRARPGVAVVLASNHADTRIERNDILGAISMFGPPGQPPATTPTGANPWLVLAREALQTDFAAESTSLFSLRHNRLSLLTVDQGTMQTLLALAQNPQNPLPGAWATAMVSGNTWSAAPLILVSENIALDQNRFEQVAATMPGLLVGSTATCIGNAAPKGGVMYCATQAVVPDDATLRGNLNAALDIQHL
jgi:hypothetical protein